MSKLTQIAWRNLLRNKRRTVITASSIFFAVFFAVIMRSFELGSYDHMIKQSIELYSGYLQIQQKDYFDDATIDNSLVYDVELIQTLSNTAGIKAFVPRVETFVLASTGHQSKGIILTGIDPVHEAKVSNPEHLVVHYKLTPENLSRIQQEIRLPETQIEQLKIFQNNVYNNLDRLAADMGLKPHEFDSYRKSFEYHCRVPGTYLNENDEGVLVSNRLAQFLRVNVGDTLVLMGAGYQGTNAAGLFPVRGIIHIPSPDLDNKLVYMSIQKAQDFLSLDNHITSVVINLEDEDEMLSVQELLSGKLDHERYMVKNWLEINPTLKQQIEGDSISGQIFIGILYVIIFFGIFGTVLMMITERMREFGVMIAIGMQKKLLSWVVSIEMLIIGLVGTLAGMLASIPIIIGFNHNPIRFTGESAKLYEDMGFDPVMPTALIEGYFAWQGLIILVMVILACYFPLKKIRKLKVMDALRA
ncbi:MAG: FtsX-like permease family protein [Salinivirgaceae bacterium]